jgi:mRNA interferase YafQ
MIYELILTGGFKKSLKRAKKRGLDISLLEEVVDMLQNDIKLEDKYRDHELKGNFKGFRECHIQPDWLLMYLKEEDVLTLTLVDTGSHADLLNM